MLPPGIFCLNFFESFFERFFVNSFGFPFGSGIVFFTIVFISILFYLIRYSQVKEKVLLNTSLLSLTFILIGYSSYSLVLIRSNFNPPIDENNPENNKDFEEVPNQIKRWNKAGGKVLEGLVRRREAEALLFSGKSWNEV